MQFFESPKTCNFLVWHMTAWHRHSGARKWLWETRRHWLLQDTKGKGSAESLTGLAGWAGKMLEVTRLTSSSRCHYWPLEGSEEWGGGSTLAISMGGWAPPSYPGFISTNMNLTEFLLTRDTRRPLPAPRPWQLIPEKRGQTGLGPGGELILWYFSVIKIH